MRSVSVNISFFTHENEGTMNVVCTVVEIICVSIHKKKMGIFIYKLSNITKMQTTYIILGYWHWTVILRQLNLNSKRLFWPRVLVKIICFNHLISKVGFKSGWKFNWCAKVAFFLLEAFRLLTEENEQKFPKLDYKWIVFIEL